MEILAQKASMGTSLQTTVRTGGPPHQGAVPIGTVLKPRAEAGEATEMTMGSHAREENSCENFPRGI